MVKFRKSSKTKLANFEYSNIQGIPEIGLRVELLRNRLLHLLNEKQPGVLEVGIGTGDATIMLAKTFKNITCVDSDIERCKAIRDSLKNQGLNHVKFIHSFIEDAKLSKGKFKHIILQNILEHLKDPVDVLKVLAECLSANGFMHINVPLANSLHRWLGVVMGLIPRTETIAESDVKIGHYRVYTPTLLARHVRQAGLKITYKYPFYLKPLTTATLTPLPMEIHRGLFALGQRFPEFASYMYMEVKH